MFYSTIVIALIVSLMLAFILILAAEFHSKFGNTHCETCGQWYWGNRQEGLEWYMTHECEDGHNAL